MWALPSTSGKARSTSRSTAATTTPTPQRPSQRSATPLTAAATGPRPKASRSGTPSSAISQAAVHGHGDGYFIQPAYDVHIIKNIIARNDCIPFYVNYAVNASTGVHGLWIVGNAIHVSTQHTIGNDLCPNLVNLGENTQTDTIIAFNSLEGDIFRHDPANGTTVANEPDRRQRRRTRRDDEQRSLAVNPDTRCKYNVFYDS